MDESLDPIGEGSGGGQALLHEKIALGFLVFAVVGGNRVEDIFSYLEQQLSLCILFTCRGSDLSDHYLNCFRSSSFFYLCPDMDGK
jgi:hypothetical protein